MIVEPRTVALKDGTEVVLRSPAGADAQAIKLYENLGFERIGLLREVAAVEEGYADEFVYQRLGVRA